MLFSKTPKRDYFDPYRSHKPWFNTRKPAHKRNVGHIILVISASTLCFLLGLFLSPLANAESGALTMQNSTGQKTPALLHSTHVELKISGMIAHVTYSQVFTNNSNEWKHAIYTFPLNEKAAINDMEMVIGERTIRGQIKPKQDAQKAYNTAKKAGKKASLTEQQRPNIFTQHVANIAPNERISITLKYIQEVAYRDGQFSFHLPTTLTPRYIPGTEIDNAPTTLNTSIDALTENAHIDMGNQGWGTPTNQVPDANNITPFMTNHIPPSHVNRLTFNATLDSGFPLANVTSRNHAIHWQESRSPSLPSKKRENTPEKTKRYSVSLDQQGTVMDRDIWLSWWPQQAAQPQAAVFKERVDGSDYAMVMIMPPQVESSELQDFARDITFVIDTSGSMGGRPIDDAKASLTMAIARLSDKDKFNVIEFNTRHTLLFNGSVNASEQHKQHAINFVSRLVANGGTEMAPALSAALKAPVQTTLHPHAEHNKQSNYIKQVVFITDGAVGNETALFAQIKRELGSARLFTVGIGSAPNSDFMTRAAQFGRGSAVFVSNTNDIQPRMKRLFTKLESPVLSNLSLSLIPSQTSQLTSTTAQSAEIYPKRIPDLYAGEPLILNVKLPEGDLPHAISLFGALVDKNGASHNWTRSVSVKSDTNSTQHKGVAAAWARKKVAALMDEKTLGRDDDEVKRDVLAVALSHHLITAYTSFIAIEETPARSASSLASIARLKNLMPNGMNMKAVSFPQTAAGINTYWTIGLIALISFLLLQYITKYPLCRAKGHQ